MKYKIPKRITTLYTILLTTALLLLPLAGVAAPQHTDINKPTRERVKKDKQQDNKKANATNKNDGNPTGKKADVKPTAAPTAARAMSPCPAARMFSTILERSNSHRDTAAGIPTEKIEATESFRGLPRSCRKVMPAAVSFRSSPS